MKAILEFNLSDPDDRQEHSRAVKATDAYLALWDISQEIFRPHRKHGYADDILGKYNYDNTTEAAAVLTAIGRLEEMFYEILKERGIDLTKDIS